MNIDYRIVARQILKNYNSSIDRRNSRCKPNEPKEPYWTEILFDFLALSGGTPWGGPYSGPGGGQRVVVIRRRWDEEMKRYSSLHESYSYDDFRGIMKQVSEGICGEDAKRELAEMTSTDAEWAVLVAANKLSVGTTSSTGSDF